MNEGANLTILSMTIPRSERIWPTKKQALITKDWTMVFFQPRYVAAKVTPLRTARASTCGTEKFQTENKI